MTTPDRASERVHQAIEALRQGGMVIMVDDEDRENEGDLVFAAAHVSAEKINFMTKEARGLICLSLEAASIARLELPMMEDRSKSGPSKSTAFTVSIEAREGVSTGISAADRAHTIRVAVDPQATPDDLVVPGHVFPLKAREGGVLQRAGHTEGSVDLVRLAGLSPAAVICEIMNDDGSMARRPDLERFAARHHLPIISIADLITYRLRQESLIEELSRAPVTTPYGTFTGILLKSGIDSQRHFALVKGQAALPGQLFGADEIVDVRVHRQRPWIDVFAHPVSGGRYRLDYGLKMLRDADAGVLLYLCHPSTPEELEDEFHALADRGTGQSARSHRPWVDTDPRMLGLGAQALRLLGVRRMRVHMSTPVPLRGLAGYNLEVVETQMVESEPAPK